MSGIHTHQPFSKHTTDLTGPDIREGVEILEKYSLMVKSAGKLVYATCSILPSENQKQVEWFLHSHKNFILEEEKQIFPSEGFDGFYMARITRQNV